MSPETVIAVLSLVGTLVGSAGGVIVSQKLTAFRLEQLERKVEKHNTIVERMFRLEGRVDAIEKKEGD